MEPAAGGPPGDRVKNMPETLGDPQEIGYEFERRTALPGRRDGLERPSYRYVVSRELPEFL